jgi:hypothetical protein
MPLLSRSSATRAALSALAVLISFCDAGCMATSKPHAGRVGRSVARAVGRSVDPPVIRSTAVPTRTAPTSRSAHSDPPSRSTRLSRSSRSRRARHTIPKSVHFRTPEYYPAVVGDSYFNTVGSGGGIVLTSDDSAGAHGACADRGGDVVILHGNGRAPRRLRITTRNCMTSYGPIGGGRSPDGCSWKSGGITRIGKTIYLAVARQLRACSAGAQQNGIQPSYNASIVKSVDGGRTWRNSWGQVSRDGAAPPFDNAAGRYRAMFPGRSFSTPFFIQYGPGNSHAVDGAKRYLYSVSTDGYAYNANNLRLARVRIGKVQHRSAWQFYHGAVGGAGHQWGPRVRRATRVLRAPHGLSQPAIQYVPALRRYVLVTFFYPNAHPDFPRPRQTSRTILRIYTAHKPWGHWTKVFERPSTRALWCSARPCRLHRHGGRTLRVGRPSDQLGLYDPALVQKYVFTRSLVGQALFTSGDFKNKRRYRGEDLYRLHAIPVDLRALLRR